MPTYKFVAIIQCHLHFQDSVVSKEKFETDICSFLREKIAQTSFCKESLKVDFFYRGKFETDFGVHQYLPIIISYVDTIVIKLFIFIMKYEITFHNKSNGINLLKINCMSKLEKFNQTYFRTPHIYIQLIRSQIVPILLQYVFSLHELSTAQVQSILLQSK